MSELYKIHRPQDFDSMHGQNKAVTILKSHLEKGTVPHAILFSGPSGCGKTTLARIMADKLLCHPTDLREINCADFRGIDMIRDIRKDANYSPMGGKTKIYLIDEFHKATNDAQNGILKLLEDNPKSVYFFLATTEPEKLLKTIRTRCTDIVLSSGTNGQIEGFLKDFLAKNMPDDEVSPDLIKCIVDRSEGSYRRALVILASIQSLPEEEKARYLADLIAEDASSIDLCRALLKGETWPVVSKMIQAVKENPESVRRIIIAYMSKVMLSGGKGADKAYLIADAFRDPIEADALSALIVCCYECTKGQ